MADLDTTQLKTFNKLYPMLIKKYETLALTEDMIVDKINAIVDYLNSVGKLTNDTVKNWNIVMRWLLDEGLTDTVNSKLDAMVLDGTIASVINNEVFSSLNTQLGLKANQSDLNTTNANVLANTTNITNNTNTLNSHTSLINANASAIATLGSGSPKGVYASLSALQTAFPTGTTGIYLTTDTGHWYYWNNSAWTDGGIYQASSVADGSIVKSKLSTNLQNKIINDLVDSTYLQIGIDTTQTTVSGNNTITYLTNTTFGAVGFGVKNDSSRIYKVVTFITNVGTTNSGNIYMYSEYSSGATSPRNVGANGVSQQTVQSLTPNQAYTSIIEFTPDSAKSSYTYTAIAPMPQYSGVKLQIRQYVYDVTALDTSTKTSIDWANISTYNILSDISKRAFLSDTSTTSVNATNTKYANPEFSLLPITWTGLVGFGATINTTDSTLHNVNYTLTTTYGGVEFPYTIATNKNYLIIVQSSASSLTGAGYVTNSGAWGSGTPVTLQSVTYNGLNYKYAVVPITGTDFKNFIYVVHSGGTVGNAYDMKDVRLLDVTGMTIDSTAVLRALASDYQPLFLAQRIINIESRLNISTTTSKKILCIGDSLTAAQQWQSVLTQMFNATITNHAKGGLGIISLVDGELGLTGTYNSTTDANGTMRPLNASDVTGKDLIIYYAGYNDRGTADGVLGDVYDPNDLSHGNTIAGRIQYAINRIYTELTNANNLTCQVLIVTPHCGGKYGYIDADGYAQYPSGSGQTLETLANTIKTVANYNNLPVCDLWHDSGIGKNTWNVFSASTSAVANPPQTGQPYPNNADQLHCSTLGYTQIGKVIAGKMKEAYGY
jgi:hypothetical protein